MRNIIAAGIIALTASAASAAEVINVEFKFTPFVGDPAKDETVKTIAGTARVILNGVPYAEQPVMEGEMPVMFDEREVAAAVWLPTESCGAALRKGKNTIRFEFEPENAKTSYRAQLRWASVMDESTEESEGGHYSATNQSGEGMEEKEGKGTLVIEREFQADFAADMPWHHYPAVTALTDADKTALAAIVAERVAAFKPGFEAIYKMLEGRDDLNVEELKKAKCLEQAYEAGARIAAPPAGEIEFATTGGPAVVIRAKEGMLFFPEEMSAFEKIEDPDVMMGLGAALSILYPPHIVVVRSPSGGWEVAY